MLQHATVTVVSVPPLPLSLQVAHPSFLSVDGAGLAEMAPAFDFGSGSGRRPQTAEEFRQVAV